MMTLEYSEDLARDLVDEQAHRLCQEMLSGGQKKLAASIVDVVRDESPTDDIDSLEDSEIIKLLSVEKSDALVLPNWKWAAWQCADTFLVGYATCYVESNWSDITDDYLTSITE